jgi:hypothetical protein
MTPRPMAKFRCQLPFTIPIDKVGGLARASYPTCILYPGIPGACMCEGGPFRINSTKSGRSPSSCATAWARTSRRT